jgi:hypothetical protein
MRCMVSSSVSRIFTQRDSRTVSLLGLLKITTASYGETFILILGTMMEGAPAATLRAQSIIQTRRLQCQFEA